MGLFTPIYMKPDLDWEGYMKAVEKLKAIRDPKKLERIVREAPDGRVRKRVVERLENAALLSEIARGDRNDRVRVEAANRLGKLGAQAELKVLALAAEPEDVALCAADCVDDQALLTQIARRAPLSAVRCAVVRRLEDPAALAELATSDASKSVRLNAVLNPCLTDPAVLQRAALEDGDRVVRAAALSSGRLADPAVLARAALEDAEAYVRKAAVNSGRLVDPAVLARVALEDPDSAVRTAAVGRVDDPAVLFEIADHPTEGKYERGASWLAAVRLTDLDPNRAVGPLVRLMGVDRGTKSYEIGKVSLSYCRKRAVAFLEALYRESTDPELRQSIASLPSDIYGWADPEYCMQMELVHFDLPR